MPASIPGNGKCGDSNYTLQTAAALFAYAAVGCVVSWLFVVRVIGLPHEPGMEVLVGLMFLVIAAFWPAWVLLTGIIGVLWLIGSAVRWVFFL